MRTGHLSLLRALLLAAAVLSCATPPAGAGGSAPERAEAARKATVQVKAAVLRAEPSRHSRKLATLRHGTRVEVLGTSGPWAEVRTGGRTGYVVSTLLR